MCVELDIAPTDGTVGGEIQLTREHTEWSGDTHRQTDREPAARVCACIDTAQLCKLTVNRHTGT